LLRSLGQELDQDPLLLAVRELARYKTAIQQVHLERYQFRAIVRPVRERGLSRMAPGQALTAGDACCPEAARCAEPAHPALPR
jgi:hypothetical protein